MATEIIMPHMGEGVIDGTVGRWLVQVGDFVDKYDPILEIETDKVTTEATAEVSGTLLKILVLEGETVEVGTTLGYLGDPEETTPESDLREEPVLMTDVADDADSSAEFVPEHPPMAPRQRKGLGRISPVVARIADEHHVDLTAVPGTGRDHRITKKDILAYIEERNRKAGPLAVPVASAEAAPETPAPIVARDEMSSGPAAAPQTMPAAGELMQLSSIRRAIADHMVRSKVTSPHVTTVFEIDFSHVAEHRAINRAQFAHDGINLTFTAYIVTAIAQALKQHPVVNSTWRDEGIWLHQEINIGIAAAIPDGLIVPVIRSADELSLQGVARQVNDLANRARANQLKPDEVRGGTFSLTNHGVTGSLFATPIINQPQCGILGVGKIEKRVKVINDAIAIRPLAYVSFTFDHRILDGATADLFVTSIQTILESWR